jgi:hypothetical protein
MQTRFSSPVTRRHPDNRGQGYRERTEPGSSISDRWLGRNAYFTQFCASLYAMLANVAPFLESLA